MCNAHDPRNQNEYWLGADLVIEIVCPDRPTRDTEEKSLDYAEAGLPEYWIVNPLNATITVLGSTVQPIANTVSLAVATMRSPNCSRGSACRSRRCLRPNKKRRPKRQHRLVLTTGGGATPKAMLLGGTLTRKAHAKQKQNSIGSNTHRLRKHKRLAKRDERGV